MSVSNQQNFTQNYLLVWIVLGLFLSVKGEARPVYLEDLPPKLKKCLVCHTSRSGSYLNAFGRDYEDAGFEIPLNLDSDHDGFTNAEELRAGTSPGDPHEYPGHNRFPWGWVVALLFISLGILITWKKRKA